MKRTNEKTLGEAIDLYLKSMKLDRKYKEYEVINKWEEIIGKTVARSTTQIFIDDATLYVTIKSPAIRNEIFMMRSEIVKRMNEIAGFELLKTMVLR